MPDADYNSTGATRKTSTPQRRTRPTKAAAASERRRGAIPDIDRIVDTAARLFHERGYQNTTMQDLAEALGIAKPTLYSYTHSKAEILGRIFDRVLSEADAVTDAASDLPDPVDGLRHLVAGQVRLSVTYRAYLGLFHGDQRELPTNLRGKYRRWSQHYVDSICELVVQGQAKGRIRSDLAPIVVAYGVIGMTNWTARWLRPRGPLPVSTVAEHLSTTILDGIAAKLDRGEGQTTTIKTRPQLER